VARLSRERIENKSKTPYRFRELRTFLVSPTPASSSCIVRDSDGRSAVRTWGIAAGVAALALSATAASAEVMTFSGQTANSYSATTYVENGITATAEQGQFWGYPNGGVLHLDPGGYNNYSYSFTLNSGAFDLISFDIATNYTGGAGTLNAYDASNTLLRTGTFLADTVHTETFTDWTGISRLEILDTGAHFSIDNLTLRGSAAVEPPSSAVPEPASWAMMLTGFGLVGGGLRRRRRVALRFA
jgi:hypothetical protein